MAKSPQTILQEAFAKHDKVTISFSGAEDVVLIDMACSLVKEVQVFCLDTLRLHKETHSFIERVRAHYPTANIEMIQPDATAVADFEAAKGQFSFYEDGHEECCNIRKIAPLRTHLQNWDAWITGQRRDQSPTRAEVQQVETDTAFSTDQHTITKYNPLAEWSSEQVWDYILERNIPYNELHDRNYKSIGCEPCTRAIRPGEHERAGRWWWEESTKKECGLHMINVKQA